MLSKLFQSHFKTVYSISRQRNVSTGATVPPPSPSPFMTGFLPNANQTQPQSSFTPEQYAIAQQMAMQNMMQQMYLQYMNQYAAAMQQPNPAQTAAYFPTNYFPQTNFGMPQPFGSNTFNSATPNMDQQAPQAQQDAPPVVQPPRFQAAAAAGAIDDEAENRDWLEILYTLSRLLVLLSLVYFYSSPGRCSIVILVIVLYYL